MFDKRERLIATIIDPEAFWRTNERLANYSGENPIIERESFKMSERQQDALEKARRILKELKETHHESAPTRR